MWEGLKCPAWDVSVVLSCADFNGRLNEIPRLIKPTPHWWGMPNSHSFRPMHPKGLLQLFLMGKKKTKNKNILKLPLMIKLRLTRCYRHMLELSPTLVTQNLHEG